MTSLSDVLADPLASDTCEVERVHFAEVRRALAAQPSVELLERSAEILGLLSNSTRLAIVLALVGADGEPAPELCVCDLAAIVRASASQTSHQLRTLRLACIVRQRRDGRLVYYRIVEDPLTHTIAQTLTVRRPAEPSVDRVEVG